MDTESASSISPAVVAARSLLCDARAPLVARLEALYTLKTEAFRVHPRIVAIDNSVCQKALDRASESLAASSGSASESVAAAAAAAPGEGEILNFVIDAYHEAIDTTDSVLLQHELLYNIGQFGSERSIPVCVAIIRDYERYHEVSRHEAIEAIGAIGYPDVSIAALNGVVAELPPAGLTLPITESVEIALDRLALVAKVGQSHVLREHAHRDFCSVDPAPPSGSKNLEDLRRVLLSADESLFARYKAMFSLRNLNSTASVEVLCEALTGDVTSCLFRHEVAFVLGQMEYPSSVPALKAALLNEHEHAMVRHEAAESLGAIGNAECLAILSEYTKHPEKLVSDSCKAALQLMDDPVSVVQMKYNNVAMSPQVSLG